MTDRYSCNEALFGTEGQRRIATTKIAIVGLGGLGSHVAQQLAYLGVVDYALIDFDVVRESNLNRLIGATDADVREETPKTRVAERSVRSIQPRATINPINEPVAMAEHAIAGADVVFGCVDRDIHRLEITRIASTYAKPYVDAATDVLGEGTELVYGGRVIFCDGTRCLVCLPELLDQDQIARDRLSPQQLDAHRRIYGVASELLDGSGPSVVSINGVVASLAVTEFMVAVTGLRQPAAQLIYRAERGIVRSSSDEPSADCYYCTRLWASGRSDDT
jgi:molybdopterin/thiamine biosynthesis adenylyltransferase